MKIHLRNLRPEDAPGMLDWMHDPVCSTSFRKNMAAMTIEDALRFIANNSVFTENSVNRHYAVADEDETYLGTISLKNINLVDSNAEYAIGLRCMARGKGVARQATRLLMQEAFEVLGLEKVYLNVLAGNETAIRFYERFGFVEEGVFRKQLRLNGAFADLKWYGYLREDYKAQLN